MDLRTYSEMQKKDTGSPRSAREDGMSEPEKKSNMSENDIRRAIGHFSKMSNDQLMRELSKHLQAKKAQGREGEIHSVIERIKPLLGDEQRKRLDDIMGSI